jgi:hypothetical protein
MKNEVLRLWETSMVMRQSPEPWQGFLAEHEHFQISVLGPNGLPLDEPVRQALQRGKWNELLGHREHSD